VLPINTLISQKIILILMT